MFFTFINLIKNSNILFHKIIEKRAHSPLVTENIDTYVKNVSMFIKTIKHFI